MRVVVLLAVAACGDNIELDPNVARSGTRLKLVRYDYGEGAREIDTQWFHDAVRDERCTPRQWFDGVTICTPAFTDTVFPTSDCNRPVGRVPVGDAVPAYFVRPFWLAGEWLPSRIYHSGEPTAAPAYAWEFREGACLGPYEVAGFDYFELGREVERGHLAQITHPEVATTSRLALTIVASDDGLYAPIGLHDRDLEIRCDPAAAAGANETVCVPDGVVMAEYFHDAQCTEPELAVAFGVPIPQLMNHHDARSGCTSYYTVGAEIEAPPLYHRNGARCVAIAAPASYAYFLPQAPLELARLDRVRDPAASRITPIELAHGDLRIAGVLLHDDDLATECRRSEVDGALRCLPETSVRVIELFDSDSCQTVVPLAEVHTGTCAAPAAFAIDPVRALHAVGAVHAAPLYHLSTGDRCLPYAIPDGIALKDVGSALPADTFAEATIRVDP